MNQIKKSASFLNHSVEYVLDCTGAFSKIFSNSIADYSFAKSAIHLHFGSILKNEKFK